LQIANIGVLGEGQVLRLVRIEYEINCERAETGVDAMKAMVAAAKIERLTGTGLYRAWLEEITK
jgi:hypothetical protein